MGIHIRLEATSTGVERPGARPGRSEKLTCLKKNESGRSIPCACKWRVYLGSFSSLPEIDACCKEKLGEADSVAWELLRGWRRLAPEAKGRPIKEFGAAWAFFAPCFGYCRKLNGRSCAVWKKMRIFLDCVHFHGFGGGENPGSIASQRLCRLDTNKRAIFLK
jgi:hypothetical protein